MANDDCLIVKCSYCKEIMSQDAFNTHNCEIPIKETKRIAVTTFLDVSCKDKKLMSGWGVDGTLYTFEVVPRKPIPMIMSLSRRKVIGDDFSHGKKFNSSDDNFTEPYAET